MNSKLKQFNIRHFLDCVLIAFSSRGVTKKLVCLLSENPYVVFLLNLELFDEALVSCRERSEYCVAFPSLHLCVNRESSVDLVSVL